MIDVSSEALKYMKELFEESGEPEAAIRIAIVGNSGFGLIVGHPKDTDYVTDKEGLSLIIDRKLLDFCKSIKITFRVGSSEECGSSGYIIEAENSL